MTKFGFIDSNKIRVINISKTRSDKKDLKGIDLFGTLIRWHTPNKEAFIIWDDDQIHDEFVGTGKRPIYWTSIDVELCELAD